MMAGAPATPMVWAVTNMTTQSASDEMLHRAILASAAIPGLGKHGSLSAPAYERRGRRGP